MRYIIVVLVLTGCGKVECGKVVRKESLAMSVDLGDRVVVAWNASSVAPGDKVCVAERIDGLAITSRKP